MRLRETIESRAAYATATLNTEFSPPEWARTGIFFWRISAVAGTTPIADCKLQAKDTVSSQFLDMDGALFAQKTAAAFQKLVVGRYFPSTTADNTGDDRGAYGEISSLMRAVFTFDRTTGDETYSFTLVVEWLD